METIIYLALLTLLLVTLVPYMYTMAEENWYLLDQVQEKLSS